MRSSRPGFGKNSAGIYAPVPFGEATPYVGAAIEESVSEQTVEPNSQPGDKITYHVNFWGPAAERARKIFDNEAAK